MSQSHELKFSDLVRQIDGRKALRAGDVKRLVNRLNKLTLLMQVSRSLMGAIDVKKLLGEILSKARIVMNADKASIFMIDHARNEIYASVTLDGSEIRLPRGAGIIGFVADSGETVNIPDAYADPRFNRDNDAKTGYRTKSILCLPIHNQLNEITGAIQVLNKLDGSVFNHEDEELLTAFAAMVGVCLENARAYEELAAERNSLEDRVVERTLELALAKAETDRILNAVEEGLFLLYQSGDNYIIGAGHSSALETIFEQEELRSKNFIRTISGFVDNALLDKTKLFLELMFSPDKKQAVLLKLNPLIKVKANYNESGKQKYLRFRFDRIIDKGKDGEPPRVDHLMVTVSDISHETELQEKLERTEALNRRHMELLLAILQSEPATLTEFLSDMNMDLDHANQLLREDAGSDAVSRKNTLLDAYRIVHSIKGNSSLLNFSMLTEIAHKLETKIDLIIGHREIADSDLALVAAGLEDLGELSEELRAWLQKIAVFQDAISSGKKVDFLVRTLTNSLEKAAASQKKQVTLDSSWFDPSGIRSEIRKPLKDLLLQLARNSAIHGIELPADRLASGKSEQGSVVLRSEIHNGAVKIVLEDDGRGIDTGLLGQKLIEQNRITADELAAMTQAEKLKLIFMTGVSTHQGVSEFAGRGMGMSIVEDSAKQIGAKITVESERGKYTKFTIAFT